MTEGRNYGPALRKIVLLFNHIVSSLGDNQFMDKQGLWRGDFDFEISEVNYKSSLKKHV
jgi:hypothetical protein